MCMQKEQHTQIIALIGKSIIAETVVLELQCSRRHIQKFQQKNP